MASLRTHPLLDKRVPGFDITGVRPPPSPLPPVFEVRRGSWMALRPGVFRNASASSHDDVVPLDKLPFLIEREAAVEVAVQRRAHVRRVQ